ncbi:MULTISPECIES: MazG nucleotide pyrophosphohydrolase domain-containing protein [Streptosporangium]|uniref:HAD superfamily Cof-like phosphohydrolase n=1 Tax=Streptosporangium brasiliense TaxID=47480 RepID=A0ABT9RM58_9ACTN|nr:MazG nucleotide pyrophosphohydrolase domain-containing protein [Streptosporangium brasiliense]MDP9870357.1 putative HAD superfamily Cof-like phosphohydrolase [Streptosporangium brasiliense]
MTEPLKEGQPGFLRQEVWKSLNDLFEEVGPPMYDLPEPVGVNADGSVRFKLPPVQPLPRRPRRYDPMAELREWHEAIDQKPFLELDTDAQQKLLVLRRTLIGEESDEVDTEIYKFRVGRGNIAALAKELADLLYVVYGTAEVMGIDLPAVFQLVDDNNKTKIDAETGKVKKRPDGKVEKPDGFVELTYDDINDIIARA